MCDWTIFPSIPCSVAVLVINTLLLSSNWPCLFALWNGSGPFKHFFLAIWHAEALSVEGVGVISKEKRVLLPVCRLLKWQASPGSSYCGVWQPAASLAPHLLRQFCNKVPWTAFLYTQEGGFPASSPARHFSALQWAMAMPSSAVKDYIFQTLHIPKEKMWPLPGSWGLTSKPLEYPAGE